MTTATNPATDFDFFDAGADLKDQSFQTGFNKLQHMNESVYHAKTDIARGGYGIADTDGNAPNIGNRQTIKHRGDRSTDMRVAKMVEVAVIGFSPLYFICEWDSITEVGRRDSLVSARYIKPADMPGANGKCRSGLSFYVVIKADADRKLYEVPFRGYTTDAAKKLVGELKAINTKLAKEIEEQTGRKVNVLSFAHWMPLGVTDESEMVGQTEKSPVTPPQWKLDKKAPERVGKEDYLKFVELRRELDEYLAQQPFAQKEAPALATPKAAPQLTAAQPSIDEDGDYNE